MSMMKRVGMVMVVALLGWRTSWADTYMIIDLSEGPDATTYPVSYTNAVPSGGWTDEHKRTKLVMRRIPAGTFIMGSPEDELGRGGDEYQRQVTLTKDFYIGVFHVTFRQWEQVMGDWNFGILNRATHADADMRPAQPVSVYQIRENAPDNRSIWPNWPQSSQAHPESFVGKLRAKTGLSTFDLPTEAQWEYAARAGTTTALSSGKNLTDIEKCPNVEELGRYLHSPASKRGTTIVGSYPPNPWGLYDMHGNMYDWCLDWYEVAHAQTMDPVGPCSGSERVRRGGCYNRRARNSRSAFRNSDHPANVGNYGFRLCMTLQ